MRSWNEIGGEDFRLWKGLWMVQAEISRSRSGIWTFWAGVSVLPEGDLRIARQFTAGFRFDIPQVPKGRLNRSNVMRLFLFPFCGSASAVPSGLNSPIRQSHS